MDYSNFNNIFLINTILGKLNLERDIHIMIIMFLLYNYFPLKMIKESIVIWWNEKICKKKNMIVFNLKGERPSQNASGRTDHYLAVMDVIRKCESVYQSESLRQRRWGRDVDVYEVSQKNKFLIDAEKNIYGRIKKEERYDGKGESWSEITLEIFSYKTSHSEIIEWIEKITKKWKEQRQGILHQDKKYIIEVTGVKEVGIDWVKYPYNSKATFENTFFPGKETLISDLKNFKDGKKNYEKNGWPWQYGVALTGWRGTGKTRILKCIAHYMDRHIIDIKMNEHFSVKELIKVMHGSIGSIDLSPEDFIVVFEEIADQTEYFMSRDEKKNRSSYQKPKDPTTSILEECSIEKGRRFLSEFLPAIDGINERHGGMIVFTTNYVERLDKALIRPGRIDFHLHMEAGYDRKSTFDVIQQFLGNKVSKYTPDDIHSNIVEKYTGAELIQICRRNEKDIKKLEEIFFKKGSGSSWGTFKLATED